MDGASPAPRRRRVPRGCVVVLALVAVLAGLSAVVMGFAFAAPDLGDPPSGVDHGETETAIATAVAVDLAAQLAATGHGVVTLSEHDLTVLIRAYNPSPERFQQPQARIRDGLVVVDALTQVGPFRLHAVGRLALMFSTGPDGHPRVSAEVRSVQVGNLGLPGFAARAVQNRIEDAVALQDLLSTQAILNVARNALDCVGVGGTAVRLGFHRPGMKLAAASADCG